MTGLLYVLCWLAGVVFGVQLIAAWYAIIDLRYRWPRSRTTILGRVGGWSAAAAALYLLLPPWASPPLWNGVTFIACVHLAFILLPNFLVWAFKRKQEADYAKFLAGSGSGESRAGEPGLPRSR